MAQVLTYQTHQIGMSQQNHNQSGRSHVQRSGYRGTASGGPGVPAYAFKSPLRNETKSPPTSPPPQQPLASDNSSAANRQRYPPAESVSTTSSSSSSNPPILPALSKDDSMLFSNFQVPSFSSELNATGNENEPPKTAPGRYRHKRTDTSGSTTSVSPQRAAGLEGVTASGSFGSGKLGQFQYNPQHFAAVNPAPKTYAQAAVSPTENRVQPPNSTEKSDVPKRYKGRAGSSNSIEAGANASPGPYSGVTSQDSRSPTPTNVSCEHPHYHVHC